MLKFRRWSSIPKNQVKRRKTPHQASWIYGRLRHLQPPSLHIPVNLQSLRQTTCQSLILLAFLPRHSDEITPNQDESWNSFAHPFPNVNEPRKAAKPTPSPIKPSGTPARQAHPKKDEAVLAITKASTTKRLTTKEDMSVATKPSNDKDITHTCSPKVIDVKNIAASPAIKDVKASTAAPAIKEVKASTNGTSDDQSKAMAFDKAAEDEDDPSFSHLNESTLTESSMDISHNSDDSNLSQRTLFLRRRARERLIEEAKLKNAKESTKDKKAASPKALPGTSRRRKLQKFLELRDSHQKFLKSVENDATENKAESVHLRNGEAESVNKGLEPRASSTNNIQRKMQQLKEKRVSQKSLESRSSKPKNQTENSESKATAQRQPHFLKIRRWFLQRGQSPMIKQRQPSPRRLQRQRHLRKIRLSLLQRGRSPRIKQRPQGPRRLQRQRHLWKIRRCPLQRGQRPRIKQRPPNPRRLQRQRHFWKIRRWLLQPGQSKFPASI